MIGIGLLIAVIGIPIAPQFKNDTRVDSVLGVLLCNPGEHLVRNQNSNALLNRVGVVGITPTCITPQGQKRDVTARWITTGLAGFAFTFLFGVVLNIVLVLNAIRRLIGRRMRPKSSSAVVVPAPVEVSLSDQLRQLEEAHKAGLVSFDEYDRLRQELLKKM